MASKKNPANWEHFQIKEVRYGDLVMRCRYDPDMQRLYMTDENGNWNGNYTAYTPEQADVPGKREAGEEPAASALAQSDSGRAVPLNVQATSREAKEKPAPAAVPISADAKPLPVSGDDPVQAEDDNEDENNGESSAEEPGDSPAEAPESGEKAPEKKKRSPITVVLLLSGIVVCVVLLLSFAKAFLDISGEAGHETTAGTADTAPPITTAAPTVETTQPPETTEPEAEQVFVLSCTDVLIPGDSIMDKLEPVGISKTEYRQYSASGGLYTEEDLARIKDFVAVKYIPAGKYLTYDDVDMGYSPINPWELLGVGQKTVTLPVTVEADNLKSYLWGNQVDLEIEVRTKQVNPNTPGNQETQPDGLDHDSSIVESVIVDTYKVNGVQIVDVLDQYDRSLFNKYQAYAAIPAAFRAEYMAELYSDDVAIGADTPRYITICVSAEMESILGPIDKKTMTVTLKSARAAAESTLQSDSYAAMQGVAPAISKAWREFEIAKELEDAENG